MAANSHWSGTPRPATVKSRDQIPRYSGSGHESPESFGRSSLRGPGWLQPPNKYPSQRAWRQPGTIGQTVQVVICAVGFQRTAVAVSREDCLRSAAFQVLFICRTLRAELPTDPSRTALLLPSSSQSPTSIVIWPRHGRCFDPGPNRRVSVHPGPGPETDGLSEGRSAEASVTVGHATTASKWRCRPPARFPGCPVGVRPQSAGDRSGDHQHNGEVAETGGT